MIPPPPQYKGVHFAPQIEERGRRSSADDVIPVEGLPTRPAALPKGETVAIQVRNNPVPLVASVKVSGPTSSFETPPPQHPKKATGASAGVMGVRDKALAASAAGCEIVFVSPDEGFNEEELEK